MNAICECCEQEWEDSFFCKICSNDSCWIEGEEIEDGSCWGFLGYDLKESGLLSEAKCTVSADIKHKATELGKKKLAEVKAEGIQQEMKI